MAKIIQYKCDMCGAECINKKDINAFTMPRILRHYIVDAIGVKLKSFEMYGKVETHLCEMCCAKIAHILEIVEPDE